MMPESKEKQMPKWQKILVGTLAVIGATYLTLLVFVSFISESTCIVFPVTQRPSPSGKYTVHLEYKECQPKKGMTAELWLTEQGSSTRWGVFSSPATLPVRVDRHIPTMPSWVWLYENELQITYPKQVTPTSGAGTHGKVKVTYVPD